MLILIILLILLFGGGGYYRNYYPGYSYSDYGHGGFIPILLVILMVWFLIGNVHGFPLR